MLLHYFYKKENKEKNYVNEIYLKNLRLSVKFIQTNKYILKKDFQKASISIEEKEIRNQMEKALLRAKEDFK